MIGVLSVMVGAYVVALSVLVGLLDRISLPRHERLGLVIAAAGLLWAGPGRFIQGTGLGDLVFVAGLAVHLTALYGPRVIAERTSR